MAEEGMSGKRVVFILLALAIGVALIGWFAASNVEKTRARREASGEVRSGAVLSDGVLYEAKAGDPGLVIARDVGSGKELWRAELGSVTTPPALVITEEHVEVEIAGTPWMIFDRTSGEAKE